MRRVLVCAVLLLLALSATAMDPPDRSWSRVFGSADPDTGYGVATDSLGRVYVVGEAEGDFHGQTRPGVKSAILTRFGDDGTRAFTLLFGPADSYADAQAVAVAGDGSVYVTGQTWAGFSDQSAIGNGDLYLAKFDADGVEDWVRIFGSSMIDAGLGLCVSGTDVFVVGYASDPFDGQAEVGGRDLCLTKYSSAGERQWTRLWGSAEDDYAHDVAVDGTGDIYVTGYTEGTFDGQTFAGSRDAFLTKFDGSGTKEWTRLFGSGGVDYGNAVVVDAGGGIYVAGEGGAFGGQLGVGSSDVFLVRYDADGVRQWTSIWGSIWADYGRGLDLAGGKLLVTGTAAAASFDEVPAPGGAFVTEVDPAAGTRDWTVRWGASGTEAYGIAVVDADSAYVAGTTWGAFDGETMAGEEDLFVSLLAPAGPDPLLITSGPTPAVDGIDVTVEWETNRASDSVVEYGVGGLTESASDATEVTSHQVVLEDILPGATYSYRVRSTETGGESVTSGVGVFVTGAPPQMDTIAVELVKGSLKDLTKAGKDAIKIKATFAPLAGQPEVDWIPDSSDLEFLFRAESPIVDLPIPAGDAGWKGKKGKFKWKSPKGTFPKVALALNLPKGTLTVKVSKFDAPVHGAGDLSVRLVLGDRAGTHAAAWTVKKPGKLRFP